MADEDADEPIRLFGDPRASRIERRPERRSSWPPDTGEPPPRSLGAIAAAPAARLGRGDIVATALTALGAVSFVVTIIVGSLILYNAKRVGAFSNPWDSTRVAIGLAVFAVGIILSALLLGVSRVIEYLVADLRLRAHEVEARSEEQRVEVAPHAANGD